MQRSDPLRLSRRLPLALQRRPNTTKTVTKHHAKGRLKRPISRPTILSSESLTDSKKVNWRDPDYPGVDLVRESHPDVIGMRHQPSELYEVPYVKGVQGMRSYSKVVSHVWYSATSMRMAWFQGYRQVGFRIRNKAKHGFDSRSQVGLVDQLREVIELCCTIFNTI